MATPKWTQEDIDTLKAAIRSGVLSVSYAGPPQRTITYQSLRDMRELLAEMEASVATAAGAPRTRLAQVTRGFRRAAAGTWRRRGDE